MPPSPCWRLLVRAAQYVPPPRRRGLQHIALRSHNRRSPSQTRSIGSSSSSSVLTSWTLEELINIPQKRNDDNDILLPLIQDIGLRLDDQQNLLRQLQEQLTSSSSNSPTFRPYWWTLQQEQRRSDCLQSSIQSLVNLQRMHHDTHSLCHQLEEKTMNRSMNQRRLRQLQGTLLTEIYTRHALTLDILAELAIDVRSISDLTTTGRSSSTSRSHSSSSSCFELSLHAFLKSRTLLQLLCDHGAQLAKQEQKRHSATNDDSDERTSTTPTNVIGAIATNVDILETVEQAVTEATHLCDAHFGGAGDDESTPAVLFHIDKTTRNRSPSQLTLIRPWLQYALVELFKNSMAITIERQRRCFQPSDRTIVMEVDDDADDSTSSLEDYFPIYLQWEETPDSVILQIHDQGGGVVQEPREPSTRTPRPFSLFEFASCTQKWDRMDDQQTYAMTRSPLQGLGVGLAMSRLQLECFGGSLDLTEHQSTPLLSTPPVDCMQSGMTARIVLPKSTTIILSS